MVMHHFRKERGNSRTGNTRFAAVKNMSLSEKRRSLYNDCLEKTNRILRVLEGILEEGKPENHACKNEQIDYAWFRRFVRQNISWQTKQDANVHLTMDDWMCWQEKFLHDLTGEYTPAPEAFDEIFTEIIERNLSPEEQSVLCMYYQDEVSLRQIASVKGKSSERIRQILAKCMRKLRHPSRRWVLCLGRDYETALCELHSAQAEYDAAYMKRQQEIADIGIGRIVELQRKAQSLRKQTEEIEQTSVEDAAVNQCIQQLRETSLSDLRLSVRSFNALTRYCMYHKLEPNAESVAKLHGRLKEVRNIGRKCIEEISEIMMNRFGVDMTC